MTADAGPILLINPNSSAAATRAMTALAQEQTGARRVVGVTTPGMPAVICDEAALDRAASAVLAHRPPPGCRGIIVAAFGDPGLAALRGLYAVPVVGIAEAGMRAAARHQRRFSVATTTPALTDRIGDYARGLGLGRQLVSVRITAGEPLQLMGDPQRLADALYRTAQQCIADGAQAVVVGGGPLARAARALRPQLSVAVVEPVPEAARRIADLATAYAARSG